MSDLLSQLSGFPVTTFNYDNDTEDKEFNNLSVDDNGGCIFYDCSADSDYDSDLPFDDYYSQNKTVE